MNNTVVHFVSLSLLFIFFAFLFDLVNFILSSYLKVLVVSSVEEV